MRTSSFVLVLVENLRKRAQIEGFGAIDRLQLVSPSELRALYLFYVSRGGMGVLGYKVSRRMVATSPDSN